MTTKAKLGDGIDVPKDHPAGQDTEVPAPSSVEPATLEALTKRVDRLEAENRELRAAVQAGAATGPNIPQPPSFGMSEGTRVELEMSGKATDPFTGNKLTGDDLRQFEAGNKAARDKAADRPADADPR